MFCVQICYHKKKYSLIFELVLGREDRVFGPATTTRGVYDAAAQHVVSGAMEGVNGKFSFATICGGQC